MLKTVRQLSGMYHVSGTTIIRWAEEIGLVRVSLKEKKGRWKEKYYYQISPSALVFFEEQTRKIPKWDLGSMQPRKDIDDITIGSWEGM
jgi:hypothetical protein